MKNSIPKNPEWCVVCREGTRCDYHKDGDYTGPDLYEPSEWVNGIVGKKYKAAGEVFTCFGYDPRCGFWMRSDDGPVHNVSERAIGTTFHMMRQPGEGETKAEFMRWAKQRALAEIDAGKWPNGLASLASDFTKHPETVHLITVVGLGLRTVRNEQEARKFIADFSE
jgi:hypothetical protein